MKILLRFALVSCLFLGCGPASPDPDGGGGGHGGGSAGVEVAPGINGNGTFLEESVRIATMKAAMQAQANGGATRDAKDAAMVVFLLKDPNIEAAGISRFGNVWARFIDGTLFMDFSSQDDDAMAVRSFPGFTKSVELPGKTVAITGNSLEAAWTDSSAKIGDWLKTDSLYQVQQQAAKLTVEDFLAFRDVSVLFWQTHAAMASLREFDRDANGVVKIDPATNLPLHKQAFAYMTNSVSSPNPPADIRLMRDSNMLALGGLSPTDGRYALTASFIKAKLGSAFASNALVAIDTCTGGDPAMVAAWSSVKVGGFVSWNNLSGNLSGQVFERFFDRMLGLNKVAPISPIAERAYPFEAVRDWMVAKGFDVDQSPHTKPTDVSARLVFWNAPTFGLLRPSITNMLFEGASAIEPYPKLLIQGNFGSDPGARGEVKWGAAALTVVHWNPDVVIVRLPPGPTYPVGAFVVAVDGRKSLPAHLTDWNLKLTFTLTGPGSLLTTMVANCYLRADVRGFRFMPQEPVRYLRMNTQNLKDSSGSIVASGQTPVAPAIPSESWTGGGPLALLSIDYSASPQKNFLGCFGNFYRTPAAEMKMSANSFSGDYTKVLPGGMAPITFNPAFAFQTGLTFVIDWSTHTIKGNTVNGTSFIPTESIKVSWADTAPVVTTAPVDSDPR